MAQDTKEDGFATLTDKNGNTYVAQMNESEKRKLTKEEIDTYYEKSTLSDMVNWFSTKNGSPDITLTDADSLSIWYRDGGFKNFNGENDPEEISKAINKKGIKAITLESDWGMSYYGKDNEILMRKADTDETKAMAELKKEGVYEYDPWLVDDVK